MSFNDPFSILFGNGGDSRRNNANNDDPIILDVEADGDGPARNTNAGPSGSSRPPRGPANPRITRKPASGGSGGSRGSKILIGVVLALAIIVGLFFGLSRFITDLMWYGQLGFQSVVWTQLGVKIGLWVAYALLMALTGFVSAWLAIRARPDSADGSTIRINGDVVEVGKSVSSKTARRVAVVISLIVGVIFGSQFNANWSEILLMFVRHHRSAVRSGQRLLRVRAAGPEARARRRGHAAGRGPCVFRGHSCADGWYPHYYAG